MPTVTARNDNNTNNVFSSVHCMPATLLSTWHIYSFDLPAAAWGIFYRYPN